MNTEIRNALKSANDKTQYDERAKRLLAQKSILAHILVNTVDEFKGMNPEEVVSYIEGEPYICIVPVEPGLTNIDKKNSKKQRIIGINTENLEINEGLVRFDIIFYVRMKDGLSQIIVNVEAQKDVPIGYNILNRAIFYVCRMVSSQKERDFINMNYDDIREEVYSMCNLGEGIEERAIIKNTVKIIINMYNNNFTLEQIALATDKSIDEVRTIIDENK